MTKEDRARIWFRISFAIAVVSLIPGLYVTETTPRHPDPATGRVHEILFKGSSRYVTDRERLWYITSFIVGAVSMFVAMKFKPQVDEEDRKERQALENGNVLGLRS